MGKRTEYKIGSGNVFTDLGFPQSEEMMAKAVLAHRINSILEERGLTQAEAAKVLGVDQPKVSALRRGRLSGFSLERQLRFLLLLGRDVEIVVKERQLRFLLLLGRDVEIVVKARRRSRSQAHLQVA